MLGVTQITSVQADVQTRDNTAAGRDVQEREVVPVRILEMMFVEGQQNKIKIRTD